MDGLSVKIRALRFWQAMVCRLRSGIEEEIAFGHLILFVPVSIGAGSIIWFCLPEEPADAAQWGLALVTGLFAMLARNTALACRLSFMVLFLVSAGMVLAMIETRRVDTIVLDSPVTTRIIGEVINREIDHKGRWRYRIKVVSTQKPTLRRPPTVVSLLAISKHTPFEVGAVLTGNARLSPPSGPALVGLNDFAFDAFYSGTGAVGYFFGAPKPATANPELAGTGGLGRALNKWIESLRESIGMRIRAVLPGDTGAFATAIFTDQRRAISPGTTEALRQAGLAHIIAISGLNMALAAGIFFVGLRSCLSLFMGLAHRIAIKKIAALGALCAISAYYLISGFAISAERAFVMMSIMLVSVLFERRSISLRNVALSAMAILILSPSAIMGPSFQMSFAATAALVTGYSLYQRKSGESDAIKSALYNAYFNSIMKFATGIFMTSLIGGLSTTIFAVEHFNRIAGYGLPANLAAAPVISFIVMPAALIAMLLMPFGLDHPALMVMGFGLDTVIAIAKWTSAWGGDVVTRRMPAWFLPLSAGGFILLTMLRSRLRYSGLIVMLAALAATYLPWGAGRPDILISEDGKLVALVDRGKAAVNKAKPPGFIFDQWKRALVLEEANSPEVLNKSRSKEKYRWRLSPRESQFAEKQVSAAMAGLSAARFTCQDKAWCVGKLANGFAVFVSENPAYVGTACKFADLVITPAKWKDGRCANGPPIISRDRLRRSGALEITVVPLVAGGFETKMVAAMDGRNRAWTQHRAFDWKTGTFIFQDPVEPDTARQDLVSDLADLQSDQ